MSLRLEKHGAIAHLLIDRSAKRNAFNQAMWEQLPALVADAMGDDSVRVLLLQSAEPGVFCAGADIGEMLANTGNPVWGRGNQAAIFRAQYELTRAAKPTIAFVDGDCVGGGCGLAIACDIRVATPRSRFGITPANLGLVYPLHDTKLLVDLVGPGQAKRMLYSAQLLTAVEALRIGLIEELVDCADELAQLIAGKSLYSAKGTKQFIRRILDGQADDDADTRATFSASFSGPDFAEGTSAFVQKRKPSFK